MGSLPARALWTGVFLILVSTLAVMGSKLTPTALIPGILGLLIALMGIWANRTPSQQPLAMNIALGLSLLGLLGSLRGIPDFITLLGGGTVERPVAAMAQFATVFICLGFVLRWLVERRRKA
ncbi:hypothetical protein [Meiothermus taiwanensis]|jgi:predicted ABC-type sugar transport system permease subunit|uniref:Uncharacterized protein n=2 Tax=Meiothermus taiwanensis TaxID=172827 RepID=A0A399E920_9DEIN|nr:hypothetical protein [Meiothermus taiwanensis]AWR87606.1 hypothetical protein Mtai_v1c23770 [Meiothermus taiwanensis WR-220]KIQ53541.1 hypothetical protein SY28_13320 [Meiothermus taiwanensis]KZK16734.1 hypothetical protein A3962_05050 [Meiothermus taiwanensis]RIH79290.1 hypothetical protein Mcate_00465 [Meiothermus taiwanensis]